MKILCLAKTALAGSPNTLSKMLNKYTNHNAKSLLGSKFRSPELINLYWDYDIVQPNPKDFYAALDWCDFIVQNQRVWGTNVKKPQCILYHAQPAGYRPRVTDSSLNEKKLVVAQYQSLYYTDANPVPNMVDVWDEMITPQQKDDGVVRIFYGMASETPTGWGYKGSREVAPVIENIKKKYGNKVEFVIKRGRPHNEVLKAKNKCDIFIGDMASGSYHISEVESLSMGAVTLCNINPQVEQKMIEVCGKKAPIIKTDASLLEDTLEKYIEDKDIRKHMQTKSREWAVEHWDPKVHVKKYVEFFEKVKGNKYEIDTRPVAEIRK